MEIADQNPNCDVSEEELRIAELTVTDSEKVLGIDINPWQPDTIPRNLYLQVDDLNRR